MIEAADAFGMTKRQKLLRVQLPLAIPNIMAGVNQTIMMSLAMVVIASLVLAPGLGVLVLRGIRYLELGVGILAGFGIVLLVVILDRVNGRSFGRQGRRCICMVINNLCICEHGRCVRTFIGSRYGTRGILLVVHMIECGAAIIGNQSGTFSKRQAMPPMPRAKTHEALATITAMRLSAVQGRIVWVQHPAIVQRHKIVSRLLRQQSR